MPISTHVNPAVHRGFSLLEVMVVVTLIALFATVAVPAMVRQGSELEDSTRRLAGTLRLMHEHSLFRSEMVALRLRADGYTPLRFSAEEAAFVPLVTDRLDAVALPEQLLLEWQLDSPEENQTDWAGITEQRLEAMQDARGEDSEREDATEAGDSEFPQVFFFPSGEASPVAFRVRADEGDERQVRLGALGDVSRTRDEEAP